MVRIQRYTNGGKPAFKLVPQPVWIERTRDGDKKGFRLVPDENDEDEDGDENEEENGDQEDEADENQDEEADEDVEDEDVKSFKLVADEAGEWSDGDPENDEQGDGFWADGSTEGEAVEAEKVRAKLEAQESPDAMDYYYIVPVLSDREQLVNEYMALCPTMADASPKWRARIFAPFDFWYNAVVAADPDASDAELYVHYHKAKTDLYKQLNDLFVEFYPNKNAALLAAAVDDPEKPDIIAKRARGSAKMDREQHLAQLEAAVQCFRNEFQDAEWQGILEEFWGLVVVELDDLVKRPELVVKLFDETDMKWRSKYTLPNGTLDFAKILDEKHSFYVNFFYQGRSPNQADLEVEMEDELQFQRDLMKQCADDQIKCRDWPSAVKLWSDFVKNTPYITNTRKRCEFYEWFADKRKTAPKGLTSRKVEEDLFLIKDWASRCWRRESEPGSGLCIGHINQQPIPRIRYQPATATTPEVQDNLPAYLAQFKNKFKDRKVVRCAAFDPIGQTPAQCTNLVAPGKRYCERHLEDEAKGELKQAPPMWVNYDTEEMPEPEADEDANLKLKIIKLQQEMEERDAEKAKPRPLEPSTPAAKELPMPTPESKLPVRRLRRADSNDSFEYQDQQFGRLARGGLAEPRSSVVDPNIKQPRVRKALLPW